MMFFPTNLHSWLTYLESIHPKEIDLGLERVKQVAQKLNLIPYHCPVLTVAGTNGKGSCVALLANILQAAGYRTGAYSSPHLLRYNERVHINGIEIDDASLCEVFVEIEQARANISLTYFEFNTLAALMLFQRAKVDVAVLEVGMGGRLDAVNIVDPDVAIISTIALDHVAWLGPDREAIGFEKAGIMRRNKPAVCGDFAVPHSIRNHAQKIGATLFCQNEDFGYQPYADHWSWWSDKQRLDNLPLPKIELQNAATALKAIELLPVNMQIAPKSIVTGLEKVCLPGRFQIFEGPVQRIFDVAHNPAAAQLVAKRLQSSTNSGRTLAVVAMLSDKDHKGSLQALLGEIDVWYVAGLPNLPRGGTAAPLNDFLCHSGIENVHEHLTVSQAYRAALSQAQIGDRIIVFGSFHTVAEAMQVGL